MESIEYVVQLGYDGSGDWEWEDAEDGLCGSLGAARNHRDAMDAIGHSAAALRIVKRVTAETVVE